MTASNRWTPRADDWRVKYGSPPIGDSLKARSFLAECMGCGHDPHPNATCPEITLFTKKPCECPGR